MSRNRVVLLIVGEETRADSLAQQFALDGYDVRRASNPGELCARCAAGDVDLVIFSASLDAVGCLDGLRALRAGDLAPGASPNMRVLWDAGSEEVVVRGFEAGADDVIRAPFGYAELLARVRALLRRPPAETLVDLPAVLRYEALRVDTAAHQASFASTLLALCPMEYALLAHLVRDPVHVYSKKELLRDVWGYPSQIATRTVDSHASRLRCALTRAGAEDWVPVVWGIGYRLAPDTRAGLRLLSA